jgi:hypothetical protein
MGPTDYNWVPLGATGEVVALHRGLTDFIGCTLPEERVQYQQPSSDDLNDAASAHLLRHVARLTLREDATLFRSLKRISFAPRVNKFVPLSVPLWLVMVRMFIADYVRVGKIFKALLITREMLGQDLQYDASQLFISLQPMQVACQITSD